MSAEANKDPVQCPLCGCYLNGPKGPDGCNHCGHMNGRTEEARFESACDQIHKLTGDFWGNQEEGDFRFTLEKIQQIVWQTMTRPNWEGTYKGSSLKFAPTDNATTSLLATET